MSQGPKHFCQYCGWNFSSIDEAILHKCPAWAQMKMQEELMRNQLRKALEEVKKKPEMT